MDPFHINLLQNLYCLFENTQNKQEEAKNGPFLKIRLLNNQ